jgi:hypothetical protein
MSHEITIFVDAAFAVNFSIAERRLYLGQPAGSL